MEYVAATSIIAGKNADHAGGDKFDIINPANEDVLGRSPAATEKDVGDALVAAEAGFQEWSDTTPWARSAIIRRIANLVRERAEAISTVLTMEIGKPISESRSEVETAAEYFDWFADEARRIVSHSLAGRGKNITLTARKEPIGPVLALTPWNFPVSLAARKVSVALAAGCSVIVRPAEEAPACVAMLIRCCLDAGVPPQAVTLLIGPPETVVVPLMNAPAIRKVSFTGSTRVGTLLMKLAAGTVKRITMELGGHAPFIVLDDAELDRAATGAALGKFRNSGQVCTSPSRFFVDRKVAGAFTDLLVSKAREIRLGAGLDGSTQMGPLATARQRDRTERLVADAVAKGATVACGGRRPASENHGYFFEPTVLTDLADDSDILAEEPFAPIAAIIPVDSADEAISRANELEFGLSSYVYGQSARTLDHVSRSLQAGVVGVNTVVAALPEMPFGGIKQSGFGREGGDEAINEYLTSKFIHQAFA